MAKSKFPKHIIQRYGSGRNFKKNKRRWLKMTKRAFGHLRVGSFYFPDDGWVEVNEIEAALDRLAEKISAKKWGR